MKHSYLITDTFLDTYLIALDSINPNGHVPEFIKLETDEQFRIIENIPESEYDRIRELARNCAREALARRHNVTRAIVDLIIDRDIKILDELMFTQYYIEVLQLVQTIFVQSMQEMHLDNYYKEVTT